MSDFRVLSPSDLDMAVRALLTIPEDCWDEVAGLMIDITLVAGRAARHAGRAHPVLGNGALSSTLSKWPMLKAADVDAAGQARAMVALARAISVRCNPE